MGRNRPIPKAEDWRVISNGVGQWLIVDHQGQQPLKHPDRVRRLHAVYLAAQAPPLRVAVQELLRILETKLSGYHGYTGLLEYAMLTIRLTQPPIPILRSAGENRDQAELDLEAA